MNDTTRTWYASRKFRLAVFIIAIAAPLLLLFRYIDSAQWVEITKWTFGLYCTGNVAEKATIKLGEPK